MQTKVILIMSIIIAALIIWCKCLYDDKKQLINDKKELEAQIIFSEKETELKLKAFQEREQSLLKDRKELEDEYKKLLEFKEKDQCYISWSNGVLPDSVLDLL